MSNQHLTEIRVKNSNRCIVFIHGVLSDSDKAWKSTSGKYWPTLIEQEEDKEILEFDIYTFSYPTTIFSQNYRIDDAAKLLKTSITDRNFSTYKTIVFVCHSMGGIIARRCIVECESNLNKHEIGLFLVASPSMGSSYANYISLFARSFKNSQAKTLKHIESNEWLQSLDSDFLNLKERGDTIIVGKELVEDKLLARRSWLPLRQVVPYYSANRYFGEALKIPDSDHISISKPESKKSSQHIALCNFLITLDKELLRRRKSCSNAEVQSLQQKIEDFESLNSKIYGLLDYESGYTLDELERLIFKLPTASHDTRDRLTQSIGHLSKSRLIETIRPKYSSQPSFLKVRTTPQNNEAIEKLDSSKWFSRITEKLQNCSYARIYLHSFDHPEDFRPKHRDHLNSIISILRHKIAVGADIKLIAYNSYGGRTGADWLIEKIDDPIKIRKSVSIKSTQATHNTSSMYLFGDSTVIYNSKKDETVAYYAQSFQDSIVHHSMKVGLEKLFETEQ